MYLPSPVLGKDGIFRTVGDGGEQLQRLQPLGLGVVELLGHLQPGGWRSRDDAGVGDEDTSRPMRPIQMLSLKVA